MVSQTIRVDIKNTVISFYKKKAHLILINLNITITLILTCQLEIVKSCILMQITQEHP